LEEFRLNQKRIQLIVYTRKAGVQQKINQYGHIVYMSKKMNYVCLYVNEQQKDSIISRIKQIQGVQKVDIAPVALNSVIDI